MLQESRRHKNKDKKRPETPIFGEKLSLVDRASRICW